MALDYGKLTEELARFYDFTGKIVLFVGAGGKQLLNPSTRTKKLIAIDQDVESLRALKTSVAAQGLQNSVDIIDSAFEDVALCGDVVYFEFCLHEMVSPEKALAHARKLAPDIVVFDHSPGSEWAFHGAEEDKVQRSAQAMELFGIRRRERFLAEQRFQDHAELLAKVSGQGALAFQRAERFAGVSNIAIPMSYELALL